MMIGWLGGIVRHLEGDSALVEVGGVGYDVSVGASTRLALHVGERAELWIHTHVREDALALYGFVSRSELQVFRLLLGVSGVGPKLANAIVGALRPQTLRDAIDSEDLKTLTSVSGVGKRLAQRLAVELSGKLGDLLGPATTGGPEATSSKPLQPEHKALIKALTGMGFREQVAERAVVEAQERLPGGDFEALLREALQEARR